MTSNANEERRRRFESADETGDPLGVTEGSAPGIVLARMTEYRGS